MTGYTEVRYDAEKKRVVVEPLELTQGISPSLGVLLIIAFRNFDTSTPWESVGEGRIDRPETFKLPTPAPEPKEEEQQKDQKK